MNWNELYDLALKIAIGIMGSVLLITQSSNFLNEKIQAISKQVTRSKQTACEK